MEQLRKIKDLLMQFPLWGGQPLAVDIRDSKPGWCALLPLGLQVLSRKEDIEGNGICRLRQSFLLRRAAIAGEDAACWLMELQNWLLHQQVQDLEPCFGAGLRLWAEAGRLVNGKQPGTGIYEVKIDAQYDKEE